MLLRRLGLLLFDGRARWKINCVVAIRAEKSAQTRVDFHLEFLEGVYLAVNR